MENGVPLDQIADHPGSNPENRMAADQLQAALDRLPDKQKAAVLLVLVEGLSHKEAAAVMNCQEATVSWRIFQARKKLKKILRPMR
jgi:RNA polymerase sigma-70 factor (ECF subfamily)